MLWVGLAVGSMAVFYCAWDVAVKGILFDGMDVGMLS